MARPDGARPAAHYGARVGGVAMALGVGFALATVGAADVWASPGHSSESATGTADSAPAPAAGSGRGVSSRKAADPTSRPPRPVAASDPAKLTQPAGRLKQPDSVREVGAPARGSLLAPNPATPPPVPVVLGALAAAVRRETSQTPAPNAATAAAVSSTGDNAGPLVPCGVDRKFTKVTIFKGIPFSLPRQTRILVKQVSGQAIFTDRSVYDLNTVDQLDWNKLSGITFTPLRPDTDAIMVAWRYNLSTKEFEIAPYYNVDRARILPKKDEIISVPIGSTFDFAVDYRGITLRYGDRVVYKPAPAGLEPNFWTSVRISPWFGGTTLPPKTLWFLLRLK